MCFCIFFSRRRRRELNYKIFSCHFVYTDGYIDASAVIRYAQIFTNGFCTTGFFISRRGAENYTTKSLSCYFVISCLQLSSVPLRASKSPLPPRFAEGNSVSDHHTYPCNPIHPCLFVQIRVRTAGQSISDKSVYKKAAANQSVSQQPL
jgi:hypothetical protein